MISLPDNITDYSDAPPGYSGHNGGSFIDAGYGFGGGQYGFKSKL